MKTSLSSKMNLKGYLLTSIFILVVISPGGMGSASEPSLESLVQAGDLPEGWALVEGPRTFTRKTLFERIDGQAELFFKYGFRKSVFGVYQNRKNPDEQIELDIYDMGNVIQAFGIFSRFRNEDRPAGIGLDSYLHDSNAFFYKGKYFVILFSTAERSPVLKPLAEKISLNLPDRSPPPTEIGYFPREGLREGSIQYFTEGLLGYRFLKKGFQAMYVHGEKEIRLFLAMFDHSQEAQKALALYRDDLSKKTKVDPIPSPPVGPHAFRGKDPYRGRILVARKGRFLCGVTGFEDEDESKKLLTEFLKHIK